MAHREVPIMRFEVLFAAILFSIISACGPSFSQDAGAYDVISIAGIETSDALKDGIGEQAGFGNPTSLWGDGTYLYVAGGTALWRIEIATRKVETITRLAGSGRIHQIGNFSNYGLMGLWGDGSYIYTVDMAEQTVRRIDLSTSLVDIVANVPGYPIGIAGSGNTLFVGESYNHKIDKVDIAGKTLTEFVSPPGPIDPYHCTGGSGCLGFYVKSPSSLSIDGENLYATGFNTTLRIINIVTGEVVASPELPFVPSSVWEKNGVLYFTEDTGNRIGKLVLATKDVSIFYPGDSTRRDSSFTSIWGDDQDLYAIEYDHIIRFDLASGHLEHFAGKDNNAGSVDGEGSAARFVNTRSVWSDGQSLYVVDCPIGAGSGSIRKLNLSTAEVSTLSTPPVRAIWGNGASLYATIDETPVRVVQISLKDGSITAVATLSDAYGGNYITGDISNIYVSQVNNIERISLENGAVSSIPLWMSQYGGGSIWSDGASLYVAERDKLIRYSLATGETSDFAAVPGYISSLWGKDGSLFVLADSGLWRISMASGEAQPMMYGGTGMNAGNPLRIGGSGYLSSNGENLYMASGGAVYKLVPAAMPGFSSFELPDRAASVNTTFSNSDSVTVGSGIIELDASSSAASGFVIFSRRENGIVVSEASVPATAPFRRGRVFLQIAGSINTGLAIFNPNDEPAEIIFYITDSYGHSSNSYSFTLGPHNQIARFLNEDPFSQISSQEFPLPSEGTLTFSSSVPVAAITLRCFTNERSEFLMTSMPVLDLSMTASRDPAAIPHFAQGGGWATSIVAVNPTDQILQGSFESYSDDGTLLAAKSYAVQPNSSSVQQLANTAEQTQTGWIRVVPAQSASVPVCISIFSFQENGITVTTAGSAAEPPNKSFRSYFEYDSGFQAGESNTVGTGIAIVNASSHEATIYFEPTSSLGFPLIGFSPLIGSLTLPAHGHRSLFLNEINPYPINLPSSGVYRIWTDSTEGISVTGIRGRHNERREFLISMTPPVPETYERAALPASFPHIAAGGGYSTETILTGCTPGGGVSGKVRYFSQSGEPMPLPLK
jgi:hypothetical protein